MKKVLLKTFAVAGCLSLLASVPAFAGWEKTDDGLWHYSNNGSYIKNAWKLDGGSWFYLNENGTLALSQFVSGDDGSLYYVNADGQMVENQWINIGGIYYYAGNGGAILKNTTTPDGYYVDANGVWDQSVAQVEKKEPEELIEIEYADEVGLVMRVYNTKFDASYKGATPIYVENTGDSDITIYDEGSSYSITNSQGYICDGLTRKTKLYRSTNSKLQYKESITIKPNKSAWIAFLIDGDETVYDKNAYFGFEFSYKDNLFLGSFSVGGWKCLCENITQ